MPMVGLPVGFERYVSLVVDAPEVLYCIAESKCRTIIVGDLRLR